LQLLKTFKKIYMNHQGLLLLTGEALFRTPIKADTKSIGRVFVERTLERHCRNLNEHKSSKESYLYFLQIQGSGYRVQRAEAASGLTHAEASRWPGAIQETRNMNPAS
jgi:hypothetical protein